MWMPPQKIHEWAEKCAMFRVFRYVCFVLSVCLLFCQLASLYLSVSIVLLFYIFYLSLSDISSLLIDM